MIIVIKTNDNNNHNYNTNKNNNSKNNNKIGNNINTRMAFDFAQNIWCHLNIYNCLCMHVYGSNGICKPINML